MMIRRSWIAALFVVAAACGGDDAATTTAVPPTVTSIPTIPVTTNGGTTTPSTTTTLPPSLAEPPVFDRWTTILASLPVDEWDEEAATEEAFLLVEYEAGLLLSSDYPSLNTGYWVIFSGDFASQEDALAHCRVLQEAEVGCYHRYLGEAPVVVAGYGQGTFVAWVDGVLSVLDGETGDVVESVTDYYAGGGLFPGALELGNDGTGVYFDVGFEDYWYACETSAGRIDYVDLTSGGRSELAGGFSPRLSPDGTRLASIGQTNCVPDPDRPGEFIGYSDTVVVTDLVTGRARLWAPSPGTAETPSSLVSSIAWDPGGAQIYVAMDDGSLRVIDTGIGAALDATPTLGPGRTDTAFGAWRLEGVDATTGNLVAVEWDFGANRSRVIEISTGTGLVVDGGDWRDGFWAARLDGTRSHRLLTGAGVVIGAPVGDLGPSPYLDGADW